VATLSKNLNSSTLCLHLYTTTRENLKKYKLKDFSLQVLFLFAIFLWFSALVIPFMEFSRPFSFVGFAMPAFLLEKEFVESVRQSIEYSLVISLYAVLIMYFYLRIFIILWDKYKYILFAILITFYSIDSSVRARDIYFIFFSNYLNWMAILPDDSVFFLLKLMANQMTLYIAPASVIVTQLLPICLFVILIQNNRNRAIENCSADTKKLITRVFSYPFLMPTVSIIIFVEALYDVWINDLVTGNKLETFIETALYSIQQTASYNKLSALIVIGALVSLAFYGLVYVYSLGLKKIISISKLQTVKLLDDIVFWVLFPISLVVFLFLSILMLIPLYQCLESIFTLNFIEVLAYSFSPTEYLKWTFIYIVVGFFISLLLFTNLTLLHANLPDNKRIYNVNRNTHITWPEIGLLTSCLIILELLSIKGKYSGISAVVFLTPFIVYVTLLCVTPVITEKDISKLRLLSSGKLGAFKIAKICIKEYQHTLLLLLSITIFIISENVLLFERIVPMNERPFSVYIFDSTGKRIGNEDRAVIFLSMAFKLFFWLLLLKPYIKDFKIRRRKLV